VKKYYFSSENLTVGYNGTALIKDININIEKGKIVTLIGPNGSGKTTILKSVAKHIKSLGGKVYVDGEDIAFLTGNEMARKMAVVLTNRQKTDRLTCEDVVASGRYPYTGRFGILSDEDRKIVYESMELVNVLQFKDKDFNEISDGQRQRVLLACAVCQQTDIIILDEPTTFLDIKYKLELISMLKKMAHKKQITIIMSLHELELAQKISDWVLCVNNGKIEKQGTPEEVFKSDYINSLFDIHCGGYNEFFGFGETEKNIGKAEVFVIAGGGKGIEVFRRLNREGIPFAVGVLHENDIDFAAAQNTASCIISEKAFEEISDEKIEEAKALISECKKVICCLNKFGFGNRRNEELLEFAKNNKIETEYDY